MSNHDLLSSLAGKPAAEMLLNQYGGLVNLAKASFSELTQVKGIGESKAKAIKSAFLLAQRLAQESLPEAPLLDTPDRVAEVLREEHRLYTVEHLHVALLNTRRRLIRLIEISTGSLDTILVHPREVFKPAIVFNASALVLAHDLCVAAHKLCYVTNPVMCSHRLAVLTLTRVPRRKECYA